MTESRFIVKKNLSVSSRGLKIDKNETEKGGGSIFTPEEGFFTDHA